MPLIMNISLYQDKDNLKAKQTNTIMQHPQFNHFTHRHPLQHFDIHEDHKAVCSGCELDVSGGAYICTKSTCNFLLHDLCFDLPGQIRHHSHTNHPLTLLSEPPYGESEFTCDACVESGHGFTYHCHVCKFDLHVECASLPEIENRDDHHHPLILVCDKMEGQDYPCYLCNGLIGKGCWRYCCLACKCGAHLECASN